MICKHFGICGGCSSQNIEYNQQLEQKQNKVIQSLGQFEIANIHSIVPSPEIYCYRNKMEFAFSEDRESNRIILGLRQKNRFNRVVNIEKCLLVSEKMNEVINTVRNWANEINLSAYNQIKHTGLLRYLVVRETTNQIMVNLIINSTPYQFEYEFKSQFSKLFDGSRCNIDSFFISVHTGKADVARAEKSYLISGKEYIEEKINQFTFRISPTTFFQTNRFAVGNLYNSIRDFAAKEIFGNTCLDVYCGSGTITIFVSDIFERLIGIESNPDSINDAQINTRINNVNNCEFVADRAEIVLSKLFMSKFNVKLSTVIVDPPRPGLAKSVIESLLQLNSNVIIYVSCNPDTMKNDLQSIVKFYKILDVRAVDMFPHTSHIETVVKLVHR